MLENAEKLSEWVDRWTSVDTVVPFGFHEGWWELAPRHVDALAAWLQPDRLS